MTSKIKVDNIENQCGGAVVTKCGGTTTIAGTNVNATTVTATNVVGSTAVKSNAIQASDGGNLVSQCGTTITLGASGDTINLAAGASQSGFGRTGTVDWDTTPKTATFSAVSGSGYFVNTTAGVITVNLPAGSAGAIVSLADYAATWQTYNVTVSPNGSEKIGSVNADVALNTEGQSVTFVYVDSTQGWINTMDSTSNVRGSPFLTATGGTETTCGDYKIHTFIGPGTFCVSNAGTPTGSDTVDYLVLAGGGGGANPSQGNGGGGAGGYREAKNTCAPWTASPLATPTSLPVAVAGYPITIGAGGARSAPGSNSIFSTIISTGGGEGGNPGDNALPGGSGGGGAGSGDAYGPGVSPPAVPIGTGNTPPVSPPQGNPGGRGAGRPGWTHNGGGGGGAGTAGNNASEPTGGPGGSGVGTGIYASPTVGTPGPVGPLRYFAGGGGGNHCTGPQPGGAGQPGLGGGGRGGLNQPPGPAPATAGTVNTGGGGGGSQNPGPAGLSAGGSGIVIIRYKFQ